MHYPYGITRMVLSKTLDILDHTPEEIGRNPPETYRTGA